jgi:hypothetical protein
MYPFFDNVLNPIFITIFKKIKRDSKNLEIDSYLILGADSISLKLLEALLGFVSPRYANASRATNYSVFCGTYGRAPGGLKHFFHLLFLGNSAIL